MATAEFGASAPGIVAHPPFSMIDRWSQVIALANSFSFVGASGCCRNLSTQIGASASTTAVCARCRAIRSAVSESVHPKIEKPSTDMTTAPITAPQIPGFKLGGNVTDLMSWAPSAPTGHRREISAVGAPGNTCDHVCDSLRRRASPLRRGSPPEGQKCVCKQITRELCVCPHA